MYRVGDRVRIREDFSSKKDYKIVTVDLMNKFAGKIGSIFQVGTELGGDCFFIKVDGRDTGFHWTEDMVLPINQHTYPTSVETMVKYQNQSAAFFEMLSE